MSDQAPKKNKRSGKAAIDQVKAEVDFIVDEKDNSVTAKEVSNEPKIFNPLKNEIVYVRPVRRKDGWLPQEHEASFLFRDSYYELSAPVHEITGEIIQPLSEKEIRFFEDLNMSHIHGLSYNRGDLSTNKKENNVWWTHEGIYTIKLKNESKKLDLSRANEYILYKMLLANKDVIAPDGDAGTPGNPRHKSTFKYKIEKEGYEDQIKAKFADKKKAAYKIYGKIDDDVDAMITTLSFANPGKRYPYSTRIETLRSNIDLLIDERIDKFLSIAGDDLFDKKVLLYKAIRNGFVTKESNKIYLTGSDEIIGRSMADAAIFLSDAENQGTFIELTNKLRAIE